LRESHCLVEEQVIRKESNLQTEKESVSVKGIIKNQTEKALPIEFGQKGEIWIPKSTVHPNYKSNEGIKQQLTIDTWILKKNGIIQD